MVGDCGYCSCCAVASSLENAFNQKAEQLITVDWIEMLNGVGGFCSRSSIFAWAGVEETISILKRDTFVIPILWSGIAGWNIIDSAGFLRLATFCLLAVGFLFRPFTSTVSYFFILFYLFFFFWWILLFLVRKRRKQATCGCVSDVSGGWKKDVNEGSLTKQSSTSSSALLLIASFFNVSPRCFIIKRYPQQLQCLLASFFSLAFV